VELSLPSGRPEVRKMRRCVACGAIENAELLGVYCDRCEKIAGDVWAGLAAELRVK
jgi:hypothetical protein